MARTSKTSKNAKSSKGAKTSRTSRTSKTKYLTYIEDTPKHHGLLKDIIIKSGRNAVTKSISNDVPITYLKEGKIVKRSPDGKLRVLRKVDAVSRTVEVGSKITIQKR